MGMVVALSARNSGNQVFWASEGRSAATRDRAARAGLSDSATLARLCETCSVLISVCPPEFAEDAASQVLPHSFHGLYVDANAISPERTRRIGLRMEERGISFVDGGIVGPPVLTRGRTWLYLSGKCAATVAACFSAGPIEAEVLGEDVGKASALKMCFAACSKGSTALLCAVLGAAAQLGVLEDLKRQWSRNGPSLPAVVEEIQTAAPKAWRFVSEMHEIAATFEAAGLPPEFHQAAAEIYGMLKDFKDTPKPELDEILGKLVSRKQEKLTPGIGS
jgi:3-hydroxyisobutyrate dehydrogenase-like beta-hydroxyacid dehydrogenase